MKRQANPQLSSAGTCALAHYEQTMRSQEDLAPASLRNYLSDVRHFMAWYEAREAERTVDDQRRSDFDAAAITTPTLTHYRSYLQAVQRQKPASVNRSLISVKRYFGWVIQHHLISYDPCTSVKLVGEEESAPRHLDDREEQDPVAAVRSAGTPREHVLIVLLLHTGLRARESCRLRRDQVKPGKRNKYREVPLNTSARKVLEEYLPTLPPTTIFLFPSGKTKEALSELAQGYLVKKCAHAAKRIDISSHDLRHRFGYRMAESVPLHRLAQIMGHDSLDTTRERNKTYNRPSRPSPGHNGGIRHAGQVRRALPRK